MTSLERTRLIVASAIMVCLLGLAFFAISGRVALSGGYGAEFELSSLPFWIGDQSGQCIAQKGAKSCSVVQGPFN
nr:hypothetical protein [uncultured Cohaesibacter sp.]